MAVNHIDSSGDDRTANNTMRQQYRVLTDEEKAVADELRRLGDEFLTTLGIANALSDGAAGREIALARTKMEEAVMWAIKGVTA